MPRRTPHSRLKRSDPALEPELFAAEPLPEPDLSAEDPALASAAPAHRESGPESPLQPPLPAHPDTAASPHAGTPVANPLSTASEPPCSPDMLPGEDTDLTPLFARLAQSAFRSRFHLREAERTYIGQRGLATIREHAEAFIRTHLAPAFPPRDGRQTPMRGHPVFIAQHATGCCCRGCLSKWHHIPTGRPLTEAEQRYIVRVLLTWISRQLGQ